MKKVITVYCSYRGISPGLIDAFERGVLKANGAASRKNALDVCLDDIMAADVIAVCGGQPFMEMPGPIKVFFERVWEELKKSPDKKPQLANKPLVTFIVGSRDASGTVHRIEEIASRFGLIPTYRVATTVNEIESAMVTAEDIGTKVCG